MTPLRVPLLSVLLLHTVPAIYAGTPPAGPGYTWKNVMLGGGGNVPGIIVHPAVPDLMFIRTDVGGSYRWNSAKKEWIPLQDSISPDEWNLYGADSLAVDPSDRTGKIVYLSTGKYEAGWAKAPGVVMKSIDGGATWIRTPLQAGGSSNTEQAYGEKLAVDPANGEHILCATKTHGLWRSLDGAANWAEMNAAPKGQLSEGKSPGEKRMSGLVFILFDPSSGAAAEAPKRTKTIYLGASGEGIYLSQDGGETWSLSPGSPLLPRRAAIGNDGSLVVSHEEGLARLSKDSWTDITPSKIKGNPCQAVAVDPADPSQILTAPGLPKHELPLYRSTDAGATWKEVKGVKNQTVPWWPSWHWFSATAAIAFDPHHRNRVWATDWYGVYGTPDITASTVQWTNFQRGHEEIVTTGALTTLPVGGIKLFSGAADVGGFDHESLDLFPKHNVWAKGLPDGLTTTGIAWQPSNPLFMARVGARDWSSPGNGGYSLDGGKTWKVFATLPYPGILGGRVAIAAKGTRILWAPQQGDPHFTDDFGKTWTKCGTDEELKYTVRGKDIFQWHQPLAADGGNPDIFYIFRRGKFWRSDDGAATWSIVAEMEDEGTHMVYTVPGKANHVWMSMNFHGLRRSSDRGETWTRLGNVRRAAMFCFGKNPPGKDYPAIFILGMVENESGYFRSDDQGATWIRIDTPQNRGGDAPNIMAGDWQKFGRVFIGTNGRGIQYAEPADAPLH